jgi:hypothetical protein
MTRPILTALFAAVLALPAPAAAPRKPPLQTYAPLWTQSPFTTKPVVEGAGPVAEVNPFEDWALGGVSTVGGRYLVVLFHRKEAERKMVIDQSDKNAEFQVAEVKQDPKDHKATEVTIVSGSKRGKVTYDEKVLSTRGAAAAKVQQAQAQKPPQPAAPPGAQAPPQSGQRPPRMRVIPPPPQPVQPGAPSPPVAPRPTVR